MPRHRITTSGMQSLALALCMSLGASCGHARAEGPAPDDRFPFDRGRAFRVAKTDDGQPALWRNDKLVLTSEHTLTVDYLYAGRIQVYGRVETVHGFVSINPGKGLAISGEHLRLRGKVLEFADLVLYGFSRTSGVVATDGTILSPPAYENIFLAGGNYIIAEKGGKEGVFDFSFKSVLPIEYDELSYVGGDRFGAVKNGRAGVVDAAGKVIVPFIHEEISANYLEGVHLFGSARGNRAGVINAQGQVVFQPRFSITKRPDKERGLIFVTDLKTGQKGVIDSKCRFIHHVPLREFAGRWEIDRKRSDLEPVHQWAKVQWDARRKRFPINVPNAFRFPELEDFKIELHLSDDRNSSLYVARQQGVVEWSREDGALSLKVRGYLAGRARIRMANGELVYEQIENHTFGGQTIDGKIVPTEPLVFRRMPDPPRSRPRTEPAPAPIRP